MKMSNRTHSIIVEIIFLLYILLFVYAALSKLLDFENFQVQLGQSPLLSAYAGWVSYLVPVLELIIVVMLVIPRLRQIGMLLALNLMAMFTAYIIIILNFTPFIPCSCGGVLEKMGWVQHLIFNLVFVFLGLAGVFINSSTTTTYISGKLSTVAAVTTNIILSVLFVFTLFVFSEDTMHHNNNFIRRFPQHPVSIPQDLNLESEGYYIAGADNGKIYLGHHGAPLSITIIDTSLQQQKVDLIKLSRTDLPFQSLKIMVKSPYFFVSDGNVPCIFKGKIKDWNAELLMKDKVFFSRIEPMDSISFAISAVSSTTGGNILGTISGSEGKSIKLSDRLLTKQIDGFFDTNGILLYNAFLNRIIYTYYYRNEFIVATPELMALPSGKTIDTISKARIKVLRGANGATGKLASPPYLVNKGAVSFGKYLFINAALTGRYEPVDMWKNASVIDVYDLTDRSYAFSFYLPDKGHMKVRQFLVDDDKIIVLCSKFLQVYRFTTNSYKPQSTK